MSAAPVTAGPRGLGTCSVERERERELGSRPEIGCHFVREEIGNDGNMDTVQRGVQAAGGG